MVSNNLPQAPKCVQASQLLIALADHRPKHAQRLFSSLGQSVLRSQTDSLVGVAQQFREFIVLAMRKPRNEQITHAAHVGGIAFLGIEQAVYASSLAAAVPL
jgi:hypothetical protein